MRFTKKQPEKSIRELTPQLAQEIYNNSADYYTPSEMFKQAIQSYNYHNIDKVYREAKLLLKQIDKCMQGRVLLVAEERDPETGEITTPAEYLQPENTGAVEAHISSELLDCSVVLSDYMGEQTWEEFQARYGG